MCVNEIFRFRKKKFVHDVNFYCDIGVVEIKKSFNLFLS